MAAEDRELPGKGSASRGEYHNKQFNIDGTYNGAYSDMIRVPRSTYMFMLNSAKQVIPSIHAHVIAKNVLNARKNASDPAAYSFYMNRARLYKRYNVNDPDVDSRIRQLLTDPVLQSIDKSLATMRTKSHMLKTTLEMKQYQKLILKRRTRFQVLENDERERFNKYNNNPSYNLPDGEPRSMKDVPYHSSVLKSFISRRPDLIDSDPSHNMYILGKKVSDDPRQASRIIHFLTHDYADIHKAPHGSVQLVDALMKNGFRIDDFGNKYLGEHLIMQRDGRVKKEHQESPSVYPKHTPHPPTTPRPAHVRSRIPVSSSSGRRHMPHPPSTPRPVHARSQIPVSSSGRRRRILPTPPSSKKDKDDSAGDIASPRTSRQILRHLADYRKRQRAPQTGFAEGVKPRGATSPPPSTSRSRRQTRQQKRREEEQEDKKQRRSLRSKRPRK